MIRKAVLSLLVASATIGAAAIPAISEAYVDIRVNVAPPPLRYEVVPQPRYGYVWTPGYWDWRAYGKNYRNGYRHVWVNGYWVGERRGYYYQPHRWVQNNGAWILERSRWDRDGDGIPNRYDRHPNNAYRR